MSTKPSDFFFGIVDFFAILVPGALLVFLFKDVGAKLFGDVLPKLDSPEQWWIAFFVLSYIAGHLLHSLGAILDVVYDRFYAKRRRGRKGEGWRLIRAKEIIMETLGSEKSEEVNFYSWAGSFVRTQNDAARIEVERIGADSKFFRSLAILLFVAGIVLLVGSRWIAAGIAFVLTVGAYIRFANRRWSGSETTYEYFILLSGLLSANQPHDGKPDKTRQRSLTTSVANE